MNGGVTIHILKLGMEVSGQLYAPVNFISEGRAPDTHWIGGWASLRSCLDAVTKKQIPCLSGNRTPVVQPVG